MNNTECGTPEYLNNASFMLNGILLILGIISESMPFVKESKCKANGLTHAIIKMSSKKYDSDISENFDLDISEKNESKV